MNNQGSPLVNPPQYVANSGGLFGARLEALSATILALREHLHTRVEVNGEVIDLAVIDNCDTSDNLLASDGSDSGSASGGDEVLYAYVSNSSASYAPLAVRLSSTAPSFDETHTGPYLGDTGDAAHWRFVAWVYVNGSIEVYDDETRRQIANFENRLPRTLYVCPNFASGGTDTSYSVNEATPNTLASVIFISNGENAVELHALVATKTAGGSRLRAFLEVGGTGASGVATTASECISLRHSDVLMVDKQTAALNIDTGGTGWDLWADLQGVSADVPATFLGGIVWG